MVAAHRVLVVDDNHDVAASLRVLLQAIGADARVVHDGEAALEMIEAWRPALVFLDIGMPGMDGYDVARAIRRRENGSRAVLVALTGWGQETVRGEARSAGFDHHIVKPPTIEQIRRVLASLE